MPMGAGASSKSGRSSQASPFVPCRSGIRRRRRCSRPVWSGVQWVDVKTCETQIVPLFFLINKTHGRKRWKSFGCLPTLRNWVYKPVRNWVDEFITHYMENIWEFRPQHICSFFVDPWRKRRIPKDIFVFAFGVWIYFPFCGVCGRFSGCTPKLINLTLQCS